VARYDSPNFPDQVPGFAARNSHDYMSAPGSDSPGDPGPTGQVIGSAVVSAPFGSSQLPENRPVLPVTAGDSCGFSDDKPIHDNTAFLAGGRLGNSPSETGAGRGQADHVHHPNAMTGQR
jgi:hypothetical protein